MPLFPEREPKRQVKEVAEEVSPLTIERKEVVQPRQTKFTKQVYTDDGKKIIETPETKKIQIILPSQEADLKKEAKGSSKESSTWFASFWLRLIKKAIHLGWKIIGKKE